MLADLPVAVRVFQAHLQDQPVAIHIGLVDALLLFGERIGPGSGSERGGTCRPEPVPPHWIDPGHDVIGGPIQ